MVKTRKTIKQELETGRSKGKTAGRLDEQKKMSTDTENTGINTLGIMGKMSESWRGVETSTKTGETDHGVTVCVCACLPACVCVCPTGRTVRLVVIVC